MTLKEKFVAAKQKMDELQKIVFGKDSKELEFTIDGKVLKLSELKVEAIATMDGEAAKDGDYVLPEGQTVTVAAGKVTAIKEKAKEPEKLTAEELKVALAKFDDASMQGSDQISNMKTLIKALMTYCFGYQLNQSVQDQAIAIYKQGFAASNKTHEQRIGNLEKLAADHKSALDNYADCNKTQSAEMQSAKTELEEQKSAFAKLLEAQTQSLELIKELIDEPAAEPAEKKKHPFRTETNEAERLKLITQNIEKLRKAA